jgi:hypothetical protein
MLASAVESDPVRISLIPKLFVIDPSKRIRLIQCHHPLYVQFPGREVTVAFSFAFAFNHGFDNLKLGFYLDVALTMP